MYTFENSFPKSKYSTGVFQIDLRIYQTDIVW